MVVAHNFTKKPYWLPINKCPPLDLTFLVYIQGSWILGKPYGIKPRCYCEQLGKQIWELDGNMLRAHWEQGKNTKKQSPPPRPPPTPKRLKRVYHECMLNLRIVCTKFLFPKLFVTIFWPGLIGGQKFGDIVMSLILFTFICNNFSVLETVQ
jgi:hypothetical protein